MDEFKNPLIIKEEEYQNGFFPKLPNVKKRGSAFVLTGGCNDDIVVDDYTTVKQVRRGKYTRLVEISTHSYVREIKIISPSKETHYSFEVYVKAVIQVGNPIVFYENKNIDVDAYFRNLLSMDIRKITRKYSVIDYEGMEEELTEILLSCKVNETTGFRYQISAFEVFPGNEAKEYVQKIGKQRLDAIVKTKARDLSSTYAGNYIEAVMTEVAEGKLSEREAIKEIQRYNDQKYDEFVDKIDTLREKDYLTDKEAKNYMNPVVQGLFIGSTPQNIADNRELDNKKISAMDQFYTEEEK
jgi:hypothetical protein